MISFGSLAAPPIETTYMLYSNLHPGWWGVLPHPPLHSCAHLPSNTWAWACLSAPPSKEHPTCPRVHGAAPLGDHEAMSHCLPYIFRSLRFK